MEDKPSVCIIGAGPSGMNLLCHLADHRDNLNIVCYERTHDVGG